MTDIFLTPYTPMSLRLDDAGGIVGADINVGTPEPIALNFERALTEDEARARGMMALQVHVQHLQTVAARRR